MVLPQRRHLQPAHHGVPSAGPLSSRPSTTNHRLNRTQTPHLSTLRRLQRRARTQVIGTRLTDIATVRGEEDSCFNKTEGGDELNVASCASDDESTRGPAAELSHTALFLHGKPGELVSSLVSLRNMGSTSLHYQWERQPAINPFSQEDKASSAEKNLSNGSCWTGGRSCFHIVPVHGCLVPGQRKDFFVGFSSCSQGAFTRETWTLSFSPNLMTHVQHQLQLHGATLGVEDERSKSQRKLLRQNLDIRQRTRGITEILCKLLDDATARVNSNFKKAPESIASDESFNFMRSNIDSYDIPLYYNREVFEQLQGLALHALRQSTGTPTDTPASVADTVHTESGGFAHPSWDMSLMSLKTALGSVSDNEEWKAAANQKVASLQFLAAIPPHPIAILHNAMYKTLCRVVTQMGEVFMEEEMDTYSTSDESTSASEAETFYTDKQEGLQAKEGRTCMDSVEGADEGLTAEDTRMNKAWLLLRDGLAQPFCSEVESAIKKLVPIVDKRIEQCIAEGFEETASWLSLWFLRLLHAYAE